MKNEERFGVMYKILTNKEFKSLTSSVDINSVEIIDGNSYYKLHNGQVIINLSNIKYLLFSNSLDFEIFNKGLSHEESIFFNKYKTSDYENFIIKINDRISDLVVKYKVDTTKLYELNLMEIDKFLNSLSLNELEENRLTICTILGEIFIRNSKYSSWKYLIFNNELNSYPIILLNKQKIVDPIEIFNEVLRAKGNNTSIRQILEEMIILEI